MNDIFVVLILAVLLDRVFGEPPEFIHSTVWMGKLTEFLKKHAFGNAFVYGAVIFFVVAVTFAGGAYVLMNVVSGWAAVIIGVIVLKLQLSWKALGEHALPVANFIEKNDIESARKQVSLIVGRDTARLGKKHIISAAVEAVGESSVDSIIAPIFYFAIGSLFGLPLAISAAVFYRVANTLDSMIGYKGKNIGTFSARMDDILNYLPARIAAILIVVSSFLLRENWRNAIGIFLRDRSKTPSPNSGQSMSAIAGSLDVQLEKIDFYKLGDETEDLEPLHVARALRIVDFTVIIFVGVVSYVVLA